MKSLPLIFLSLLCLFTSCSRKNENELFTEGKDAEEQKNFQPAVDRYEEVVSRFRESPYAESALYRAAVIYNNDLHDIPKAVDAYQRFCSLFPGSKQAATALFLSGFLLNNELHKIDSAKNAYETFLQKYPEHELAVSARFELENLGKEPGQFMQNHVASNSPADSAAPQGKKNSKQ